MTATFRVSPVVLMEALGLIPRGNAVTDWWVTRDGNLEVAFEGIDAPMPVDGEQAARVDLMFARDVRGALMTWFQPAPEVDVGLPEKIRAAVDRARGGTDDSWRQG